jgi:NitT/TauT family transport system substrate-binding protein
MQMTQTRRRFLTTVSLAGAAGLVRAPRALAGEGGSLETTTVRLAKTDGICIAPQYVADELLRAEGFTDVRYVDVPETTTRVEAIVRGALDFSANFAAPLIVAVASGEPITFLAGVHVGCFELFGNESIRSIADLKGKSVGVPGLGSNQHVFLTAMAAHVGLDPTEVRAILKAADLCATEPAVIARRLVNNGFTDRYDDALQMLSDLPYDRWREYNAEDTVRFYALRLHEAGMIKSSPQKIIADSTNWRFLDELKRELKA